jgi:hypothetical protein
VHPGPAARSAGRGGGAGCGDWKREVQVKQ